MSKHILLIKYNSKHKLYLSTNQQQLLHSFPQCGASRLQERLAAGPGVVRQSFLHQSLAAGLFRQQGSHSRQHQAQEVPCWHQREADVGEELTGIGGPFGTLAEPLQGGLKKSLLTVMLHLVMKRGALKVIMAASYDLLHSQAFLSRRGCGSQGHIVMRYCFAKNEL